MMTRSFALLLLILTTTSVANAPGIDPAPAHAARARPLPFFYDLYTFRGSGGRTAIVASFAVAAGRLQKEDLDSQVRYRFDVTLVLADTALRSVSRTDDSVFVRFPRPPADEHLLHTHIEVNAPPSGSTVQRVIMTDATTPGIGQLYGSSFPIPDYSGSDLMLSDIALGQPDAEAGWRRGDVTLALLPTSQFPSSSFDVFYEVYNLSPNSRYATEITVAHLDDAGIDPIGARGAVRLRFSGESGTTRESVLQELRRVEASLDKGSYRITVAVTDEDTGRRATRSRDFEVRGWARGTTLVAALPRGGRQH